MINRDLSYLSRVSHTSKIISTQFEREVKAHPMDVETLRDAKRMGFSDKFIGQLWGISQYDV